jgi:hypothetical protein
MKPEAGKKRGDISNKAGFLPLKGIDIDAILEDSIAVVYLKQTYVFPLKEDKSNAQSPVEVTFKFPKESTSTVAKMNITIGDNMCQCVVLEKKKAK